MIENASPPNRIPWPPILYIVGAVIAIILGRTMPLPWVNGVLQASLVMTGVGLIAAAVAIELAAALTFRRARTTILPTRAASALITSGPFRFSRNPIYLANTMLVMGAGLSFGNGWMVLAACAAAIAVHHLAILREERHLDARFGEDWRAYCARTPRWVWLRTG